MICSAALIVAKMQDCVSSHDLLVDTLDRPRDTLAPYLLWWWCCTTAIYGMAPIHQKSSNHTSIIGTYTTCIGMLNAVLFSRI